MRSAASGTSCATVASTTGPRSSPACWPTESTALLDEFFRDATAHLSPARPMNPAAGVGHHGMTALDLGPATRATAALVAGIRDDQLGDPTPCPAYTVADLLDHVAGLVGRVHRRRAQGRLEAAHEPSADGSRLAPDFRDRIAAALAGLAEAWRTPGAFDGMTMAGPVELPADVAALVALNEVVVHGWDLARATGQPYDPDPAVRGGLPRLRTFLRGAGRGRRRALRAAGRRPLRRPGARPARRRHRPPSRLGTPDPARFRTARRPPVTFPAVACPSGLRRTPRKRLWAQVHRGFKSLRHRQPTRSGP